MDSELGDRGLNPSESDDSIIGRDGGERNAARPLSYTEQFEKVCPYYMAMGMSYEMFWNGDVNAVKMYRKAFAIRQTLQHQEAWEHGMYVYEALCDVAPILRAFSKARKPRPYPEKPYEAEKPKRELKSEEQQQDEKAKSMMEAWMIGFNKQFTGKGKA